jgi:hypothetical protein
MKKINEKTESKKTRDPVPLMMIGLYCIYNITYMRVKYQNRIKMNVGLGRSALKCI